MNFVRLVNISPRFLTMAILGLTLSGCGEWDSIHDQYTTPASNKDAQVVTVDAKQRHLVMIPVTDTVTQQEGSTWRVCAEAAPDVFSAYAASASGKANFDGKNVSAEFGISGSETASTIERSQTINMLRESMYRTCERYASGAINKTTLVIQAARDQRTMLAILAIEQLTGAVRPKPTIISGPAVSANVVSGDEAAKLIKDYSARLDAATAAENAAQTAVDDKNGDCHPADGESADVKANKDAGCTALKATLVAKQNELATAQKGLDNVVALGKDLVNTANASTTVGTAQQGSGTDKQNFDSDVIKSVAATVALIQQQGQINEAQMFCIGYLSDPDETAAELDKGSGYQITSGCLAHIFAVEDAERRSLGIAPLSNGGISAVINSIKLNTERAEFISDLSSTIAETPDGKPLGDRINAFETAAKEAGNELSSNCVLNGVANKATCIAYLAGAGKGMFVDSFREHSGDLKDALAAWSKSLTASARKEH